MDSQRNTSLTILLHSTAYYFISYIFILTIFQYVSVSTALFFEIPSIIRYNKIDFLVNTQSWNFDSVKMIFSTGCIAALIFGLVFLVIYIRAMKFEGLLKMFFFWGFIHGLNMFVGSAVLGAFIREGMGYVYEWMYFKETEKMLLLFIGLTIMMGTGSLMVRPMYLSANSYFNTCKPEIRGTFRKYQFLFPYLVSTPLLILLRTPLSIYETLLLVTPGFALIPLFAGFYRNTLFYFDENERIIKLRIRLLVIALIFLAVFRVIYAAGIRIG